jgi:hypothetical protein
VLATPALPFPVLEPFPPPPGPPKPAATDNA